MLKEFVRENIGEDIEVVGHVAIALSGGGYRAMTISAGVLMAYDNRSPFNSSFGGLLQSATYIAGISGGSWMVMSNVVNDFKPVHEMIDDEFRMLDGRLLEGIPDFDPGFKGLYNKSSQKAETIPLNSVLNSFGTKVVGSQKNPLTSLLSTLFKPSNATSSKFSDIFQFYKDIHLEVSTKKSNGNHVSFTDYWGRALSRRIFYKRTSQKFSEVMNTKSFTKFEQPFPIICSVQKTLGKNETNRNSHLIEITPFEFGSWDSYLKAFTAVRYLGSELKNGHGVNCKRGYDDVGFLTATSSSLFNSVFMYVYNYLIDVQAEVRMAIQTMLLIVGLSSNYANSSLPKQPPDFAIYSPNPFYKYEAAEKSIKVVKHLYLADGGSDGQNIPFQPLLQPVRGIDLILAFDMSSDLWNFPNGSSLVKASQRYHNTHAEFELVGFEIGNYKLSVFPRVPQININTPERGPLFLGCDPLSDYPILGKAKHEPTEPHLPPLIVYSPNQALSTASNASTFKLHYNQAEVLQMLHNGYDVATRNNTNFFAACIACAIIKRTYDRNMLFGSKEMVLSDTCQNCFNQYCWHSSKNQTVPKGIMHI